MPRTKNVLHRFNDGSVEEELIFETHWVQMVGTTIVRCDNSAKKNGVGAWTTRGDSRSSYWLGGDSSATGVNPKNWIADHHTESFICEVDYS